MSGPSVRNVGSQETVPGRLGAGSSDPSVRLRDRRRFPESWRSSTGEGPLPTWERSITPEGLALCDRKRGHNLPGKTLFKTSFLMAESFGERVMADLVERLVPDEL